MLVSPEPENSDDPATPSRSSVILIHNPVPQKQQMAYLGKPRWIDSGDQDRPFPAKFRSTREERETAEAVQFHGEDDFTEYAVDFSLQADDFETPEGRVLVAAPDPLLDEPEWGTAKSQPEIKKGKESVQATLDPEPV
jgi:hypothetical protein